jgi:hypothetical protein
MDEPTSEIAGLFFFPWSQLTDAEERDDDVLMLSLEEDRVREDHV